MIKTYNLQKSLFIKSVKELLKITLLSLCIYAATDYAHPPEANELAKSLAGNNFLYLTHWGLYLTIFTIIVGYTANSLSNHKLLLIYKNLLSITIPVEIFIVTAYWGLYFIDPMLVRNRDLYIAGVRTSTLTDISLHLVPLILLIVDQTSIQIEEQNFHYFILSIVGFFYFAFSYYYSTINGSWPYPFLDDLSTKNRSIFIVVFIFIILVYYKAYFKISNHLIKN